MTERTLEKIAKDLGTKVVYRKYRYWDSVPYINGTALCFDVTNENGSMTIAFDPEYFPKFVTIEYVSDVFVDGNSYCVAIYFNEKKDGTMKDIEVIYKAIIDIPQFEDKLAESIFDAINKKNNNRKMIAKDVISVFLNCNTQSKFDVANNMLMSICGYDFKTLVEQIVKSDNADNYEWKFLKDNN